jgi:hypothetical protein
MMKRLALLFLLQACGGNSCNRTHDACGYDPKCEPATIGSMVVGCQCYDRPVRQVPGAR